MAAARQQHDRTATSIAALEAELSLRRAADSERNAVEKDAARKRRAERKVLVTAVRDLRRRLVESESSRAKMQSVSSHWDEVEEDEDEVKDDDFDASEFEASEWVILSVVFIDSGADAAQ